MPSSNVGWSSTSGGRKLISGKNHVKISAQSELWISRNIRNNLRPDLGSAKQKRTEREIQSRRGSRPSAAMETMDQRGNPPPIWGGEAKVEEEGGGLSPPHFRWRRSATGATIVTAIYISNLATVNTNSPPLCSGVTPLLPAVIST